MWECYCEWDGWVEKQVCGAEEETGSFVKVKWPAFWIKFKEKQVNK